LYPQNTWCFDLEIVKAIQGKNEQQQPGIAYCKGWNDHAGMGISVLVVARPDGSDMKAFIGDGIAATEYGECYPLGCFSSGFPTILQNADLLIGHNSRSFDAKVLAARGFHIPETKHLDFYHEVKLALKQPFPRGYNLNALSQRCGGPSKTDDGALAPHLWQQGERKRVVDYCKNDILMTCAIAQYYHKSGGRLPAVLTGESVTLRTPGEIYVRG
jgi:hypothetical protein